MIIIDWMYFIKFIEYLYKNKLNGFKIIENYFCQKNEVLRNLIVILN